MEITLEALSRFVREHGSVSVLDTMGQTRRLQDGEPDIWELAEKAGKFRFEGRWHERAEFEKLMDERMNQKPANVFALPLEAIEHLGTDDPKSKKSE